MARQAGRNERRRGRCGRIVRQRFLIVCEGEKTEPGYFRSFQVPGVVVDIHSTTHHWSFVRSIQPLRSGDGRPLNDGSSAG